MKIIQATKGNNTYCIQVDDEDFERLSKFRWRVDRYVYMVKEGHDKILMTDLIMSPWVGVTVDHIDHNPWNNQKSNLRFATQSQQYANRTARDNKVGFRGVYVSGPNDPHPFYSQLRHKGKVYSLGTFDSAFDAAMAFNAKAIFFRGEFALLNDLTKCPEFIGPTLP